MQRSGASRSSRTRPSVLRSRAARLRVHARVSALSGVVLPVLANVSILRLAPSADGARMPAKTAEVTCGYTLFSE